MAEKRMNKLEDRKNLSLIQHGKTKEQKIQNQSRNIEDIYRDGTYYLIGV